MISSQESDLAWIWPIMAAIGGVVVIAGLIIEKAAEWMNRRCEPLLGYEAHRQLENVGWLILMVGILVETGMAFALAVKDEQDITAAKTAWRNQRIYAFEATARILVRPLVWDKEFEKLPRVPFLTNLPFGFSIAGQKPEKDSGSIILFMGRSVDMASGTYSPENAQIEDDEDNKYLAWEIHGTNRFIRIDAHFGGHHENFIEYQNGNAWEFGNDSLTPEDFDAIDLLLPFRCEVISGDIKMSIDNGLTNMVFQIPPQKTFENAATSVLTNGVFIPIDFSPKIRAQHEMGSDSK